MSRTPSEQGRRPVPKALKPRERQRVRLQGRPWAPEPESHYSMRLPDIFVQPSSVLSTKRRFQMRKMLEAETD